MSPDRDPGRPDDDGPEVDEYDDDAPRSIFSALWFRALLAVLVLGMLAAVAVPYVLDFATQPTLKSTTAAKPAGATSPTPTSPAPSAAPTAAPAVPTAAPAGPTAAPAGPTAAPSASATAPSASTASTAAPAAAPVTAAPAPARPAPAAASPAAPKAKPAPAVVDKPAAAEKPRVAAARVADAPRATPKSAEASKPTPAKAAGPGGPYWVQVGAFKDGETAKRLVTRLRGQGMRAEESTTAAAVARPAAVPAAGDSTNDRYDVVVSGASTPDINAKLAAKGMTGETAANSVVVRPSLPLREAVALSRELADGGLNVQVRRVGGPAPAAPTTESRETLHRVRVGGFPDRAAALAASKQLEDKGYKTFIARESQ
jgi:cell division septation protein DedD